VIGTSELHMKYESHEANRALRAAYHLFLADERVLPSLSQLLGFCGHLSLSAHLVDCYWGGSSCSALLL
jgi:hypothetical protein